VGAGERLAWVLDPRPALGQVGHDDGTGRRGRDDREHEHGRQRDRDRQPTSSTARR
jgi:hypothetical protein